jgi:prepilin-type N-terminal cleavage/methylation domain-containing protein
MKKNKNKSGFTIIEILIVVAIIGILASVVMVSLHQARQKAADLSVFYSVRSAAGPAFACLDTGLSGVMLSAPSDIVHNSICIYSSGDVNGYSDWPDVTKNAWKMNIAATYGDDGFYWCRVGYNSNIPPGALDVGSYGSGFGGSTSPSFCYMFKNNNKYIWCTEEGCRKEGF